MPLPLHTPPPPVHPNDAIDAIRETLARIRFGSIAITVHDGRIVQLDVTEKRRLAR
jgi:hypothetical protein